MKIAQTFDLEIISIKYITITRDCSLTGPQIPAYEIFGKLTTSCQYAYFPNPNKPKARQVEKGWHFSAVMAEDSRVGRYFISIGPVDPSAPDFLRDIIGEHLRSMDLSGVCDLNPAFKADRKQLIQESYE